MRIFKRLPGRTRMAEVERRLFETIVAGLLQETTAEEDSALRPGRKEGSCCACCSAVAEGRDA
jgi:hypothetical protein